MSLAIEQIELGVRRLRMRSWRGALVGYDVSAYLLGDVLIDTGFRRAERALLAALDSLRPRGVVVTHWHEDHAGNVPAIASRGLPMAMHPGCEALLRERPAIRPYRRAVWGWTKRLTGALEAFDPAPLSMVEAPGHSPDHQMVWDAERRILVAGDLYLGVKVRVAHEDDESPRALVASLRRAAALEPRLLLDAHRGPVPDAAAQLRAKADWNEEIIGRIERLHAEGVPPREIVRRLFGGESLVGLVSGGEYSRRGFVRAVLEGR
ncbi:MAG TPA: MBL fold metallo-hydrolase [Gemmatimonadaceae bacterium]|nr:MBL fold metallo-hydrolase [Gemmatimonadaceae bacterium]